MRRAFSSAAKAAKNQINGNPELESTITNLLRVRRKAPDSIYVGSKAAARRLISELRPHLTNDRPLLEINPGFGFLTRELVKLDIPKIKLFESSSEYECYLKELKEKYPNKLDYKISNFFTMWKSDFMDRLDSGERINKMFEGIQIKPWGKELTMTTIGCLPSSKFLEHLNMSMIFQETIFKIGRSEFYLLILPKHYLCFDCSEMGKVFNSYRSTPTLFNMLFNHKIVTKLPRSDYLPAQTLTNENVYNKKKSEILTKEREYIYLVHISGKENIPTKTEYLPLLWYFCKHHLRNKENRIIPKLEEWIPGCGIWLITGQDPPGTNVEIGPNETDEPLPHITIFTQFQDLSTLQLLTLFKKFISWPEFEQSPFKEIVDNHLNKSLASYDSDSKIDIEQEDEPHEHQ